MSNIVIKTEHLSKYYRLGVINNGVLFRDLQTWWALKRGKQDPHSRIGENKYDSSKEGFWALKDLNFEIQQGDRVGIIGKNGAGKSTLLKILSRITAPTEGEIKIKGRVASLLEVGTGFHGELTGRENIYLNGAILGMKRREVSRKLDEIIAFSEIEQHIDTPVKRYSSGMYVRLAFAVAAHLDSEILIADEVLAVGDASFQKKALGKMNELSSGQGRTVLFVSHQMNAVKTLCNKGMVLEKGKIVHSGSSEGSIEKYLTEPTKDIQANQDFSAYGDEHFELINFSIVDEQGGKITKNVSNNKQVYVKIDFNYKQKSEAFNVGYALYAESGELLFWSNTTDMIETEWLKFNMHYNSVLGEIPKYFLNEGNYKIRLMASLHFQKWIINPESSPILNLFIKGGLSDSPYWYEKRPGLCAPKLNWFMSNKT